jgi:heme exporter protein CcmD
MMRFLQMGGYAVYLWPALALTFLVAMLNIAWARRSLRTAQAEARRSLVRARAMQRAPAERSTMERSSTERAS